MEEILSEQLDLINYSINLSAFAYLFIVSDDVSIRNFFINNISNLESVRVIDDSKIENDVTLLELLKEKNVLLLNTEKKSEQIKKMYNKEDSYNSLYYRLVYKREFLWENKKTIIVVSDEKSIIPIIKGNQSLASASSFYFVDDYIYEQKNAKKLIK